MFLEDIWRGATGLAGGTLSGIGQVARATSAGQSLEKANQRERAIAIKEQMDIINGNFKPEVKEQAAQKLVQLSTNPKAFEKLMSQLGSGGFHQPTGQDLATPDQRTQKYIDPYGRGQRGGGDTVEQVVKLANAANTTQDDKLSARLTKEANASMDRLFPPEPRQPEGQEKFEFVSPGIPGRRIEPGQAGHSFAPETTPVDNRGLFSGGGHSFEGTPQTEIGEYFQVPTETVPEENIPKMHIQLGMKSKDSEEAFEQLRTFTEKNIENFNLEQSYTENQEHYEKLFLAWREGVPDGKGGTRKLTNKEIIQILRSMGQ